MCLQFGFVISWQKDFGTKAAHKMLVKLTLASLIFPGKAGAYPRGPLYGIPHKGGSRNIRLERKSLTVTSSQAYELQS
jgi:hypothetical protein